MECRLAALPEFAAAGRVTQRPARDLRASIPASGAEGASGPRHDAEVRGDDTAAPTEWLAWRGDPQPEPMDEHEHEEDT